MLQCSLNYVNTIPTHMGEFIIMVFEINIQCIFTQLLSLKHTLCLKPNPNIAMFPSALATVMSSR